MNIKEININAGQYLEDVMPKILADNRPAIPTNTILNKVITGCGATTLEINAPRHSIIIEPNVPVIIGKKAQHNFLFDVYEGTTREDVKAYLAGDEDGYRKIITTPEGFDKKVLPAMYELAIPVYEEYFLLFDECEKPIQDVGYRGDIVPANEANVYMRQLISDNGIPFEGRVDRKVIGLFFELEACKQNQARAFKLGKKKYEF